VAAPRAGGGFLQSPEEEHGIRESGVEAERGWTAVQSCVLGSLSSVAMLKLFLLIRLLSFVCMLEIGRCGGVRVKELQLELGGSI